MGLGSNILDKWPFRSRARWGEGVHGHLGGEGKVQGIGMRGKRKEEEVFWE